MSTTIRFFGVAAYEIVNSRGQHILIDPFLDGNPGSPVKSTDLERVDLILVTHAAGDHFGDTESIARRTGAPVICGAEVKAFLVAKGIPLAQIQSTVWGVAVEVAGVRVQPVECRHSSLIQMPDGSIASGPPLGFVVYVDPGVRFYHSGDTAIFSDLKLIGQLYQPTVACLGIATPVEIMSKVVMAGRLLTVELSPYEGALAAQWLGLKTALPCLYINPDCDEVREFERHLDEARARGENAPDSVAMKPGDVLTLEP